MQLKYVSGAMCEGSRSQICPVLPDAFMKWGIWHIRKGHEEGMPLPCNTTPCSDHNCFKTSCLNGTQELLTDFLCF